MDRRIKFLVIIVFAVIAAVYIRHFYNGLFALPPSSMEKSLTVGNYKFVSKVNNIPSQPIEVITKYDSVFANHKEYITDGFDYPVGSPDAKGYYDAQSFTKNSHLGEDWNGIGGGNSDLGDPVYVVANGYVTLVHDYMGGWGNVIRVIHKLPDGRYIETLYAHEKDVYVKPGDFVKRGQKIGIMGNLDGAMYAHVHFEMRHTIDMDLGGGYSSDTTGFMNPKAFIKKHRPIR